MIKLFLLLFFFYQASLAAIGGGAVWEIRSTATAANANGCFFVAGAGTDLSTADPASYGFANLASTDATTTCTVTSASHNFVTADIGNGLHILSGTNWTPGWYQILSVAANAAVLDRACGSVASVSSGTFNVGGACSLGSSTANQTDANMFNSATAGNKFWFKAGTYSPPATATLTANGTVNAPIMWEGYSVTRGDAPTGLTDRPIISLGASIYTPGTFTFVRNMIFTGSGTSVLGTAANDSFFQTKVINTSTTDGRNALNHAGGQVTYLSDEFISYRGRAVNLQTTADGSLFKNCYIHDSDIGMFMSGTTGNVFVTDTIFKGSVTANIDSTKTTGLFVMDGVTVYGGENKLGIGFRMATGNGGSRLMNSIFYGLTSGVEHADAVTAGGLDTNNDYFNNTTDVTNWVKGATVYAVNPNFVNVTQITGTGATSSTNVLTAGSGTPFGSVTDNVDFVYLSTGSGTGFLARKFLITSHTSTTLTVSSNITSSGAGTAIGWQVTLGNNFAVGTPVRALGLPGVFPAAMSTGYLDLGAVQRRERITTGRTH